MKKFIVITLVSMLYLNAYSQLDLKYQTPPDEIMELADAKLPPYVNMNEEGNFAVLLYRNQYTSSEELYETELRRGELRINPVTNISTITPDKNK